jgi:serine/threonine protein phosphatase 1
MWKRFSRKTKADYARVPSATRVYAIGDVHGRVDLLERVFSRIDRHRDAYPTPRAIEVMLGDYIDRGPRSCDVIELLVARRHQRATVCLMGNHETYLLDFLNKPASSMSGSATEDSKPCYPMVLPPHSSRIRASK